MNLIDTALSIALSVHTGQVDKYGAPYILHPLRVAMRAQSVDDMVIAILHDVVEDGDGKVTLDTLRDSGFPEHIVAAVDCLSKRVIDGAEEEWEAYIARVMTNSAAMRVKLLDLEDNLDVRRIPASATKDDGRFRRYEWARECISKKQVGAEPTDNS
ncbi:MAG: GTP pyrophosphokinase [Bacteroidia bacterium]|nr:GTP pyrophosphokinase [Bacteroidia bacterium]